MATEPECSKNTSIVGEDTSSLETLKESIRRKVGTATSPLPSKFKVPQTLRRHNSKAYEPDVISIGPFHRGHGDQFKLMEYVKQLYLDTLLTRMKISFQELITRIDNVFMINDNETEKGIIAFEKQAREFYAEPLDDFKPRDDEFIKMMIRDACFVIQLVRKFIGEEKKDDNDPIWNMDYMFKYVCRDLLLLENQLPWFVLSCLYRLTLDRDSGNAPKLSVALLNAFKLLEPFWHTCDSYLEYLYHHKDDEVLHILDLIRTSIVFSFKPSKPSPEYLWCFAGKADEEIGLDIHPATALSEAGVIFEKGSANNLMTIKFEKGVLTIPQLAVGELTEPLFRNLIAFEQVCDGCSQKIITSYAIFMGKLISSESDIELLSRKKIIRNWPSIEDGFKFFNNLSTDTTVQKFEYDQLCAEVDKYSQVGWNKHVAQLRRDYFSSPWTVISLTVGIILLVITIFQFINTILSSTVLSADI